MNSFSQFRLSFHLLLHLFNFLKFARLQRIAHGSPTLNFSPPPCLRNDIRSLPKFPFPATIEGGGDIELSSCLPRHLLEGLPSISWVKVNTKMVHQLLKRLLHIELHSDHHWSPALFVHLIGCGETLVSQ